ncbi:hypothetical protein Pcinc_039944 [Petrolisthes cinctipes]|uniref:Uncharacterized protein n=1 Tax=Petrolisthes cinctipes TaxID=88211 RepID=A0AAE1ELB7_PETCI|nr:hypothetical protein Pcinc_039944 [Petrolisthes cinctipes]
MWSQIHLAWPPWGYRFGYNIVNGISSVYSSRVEQRQPPPPPGNEGDEGEIIVRGSYSYLRPDGVYMTVRYTVDDWGYKAMVEESKVRPGHFLQVGSDRAYHQPELYLSQNCDSARTVTQA